LAKIDSVVSVVDILIASIFEGLRTCQTQFLKTITTFWLSLVKIGPVFLEIKDVKSMKV